MKAKPKTIELPSSDQELLQECEIKVTRCPKAYTQANMSSCAIRLKHLPTGIVIRCYQEKDRYLNQIICLKKLRLKVTSINCEIEDLACPVPPRRAKRKYKS